MEMHHLRREYRNRPLRRKDLELDPIAQFHSWFEEAKAAEVIEPNAMVLSTAAANGVPSARTVLLKGLSEKGFVFFTNYESRKAQELKGARGCLLFLWMEIARQIIIEGTVEKISREESEAYFKTRPRQSQLGAWASRQDRILPSREALDAAYEEHEKRFEGQEIPLPLYWGGYRLEPSRFEFWQGREKRLHDRFAYTKSGADWQIDRLSP